MSEDDEIIYSLYLFGYSNYSRVGYAPKLVHFTQSPQNPQNDVSTILGGVGLAISAHGQAAEEAVDFVNYVAHPGNQDGAYMQNAGHPGNLQAWKSKESNVLCHNFFIDTLETLQKAYVRPQHPGWNGFQEQGADLLHQGLVKNESSDTLIKQLNEVYRPTRQHE